MKDTTNKKPILEIGEVEMALINAYEDISEKRRDSQGLGRTLDGQMGYFICGQVQTPDGQCDQGYKV